MSEQPTRYEPLRDVRETLHNLKRILSDAVDQLRRYASRVYYHEPMLPPPRWEVGDMVQWHALPDTPGEVVGRAWNGATYGYVVRLGPLETIREHDLNDWPGT